MRRVLAVLLVLPLVFVANSVFAWGSGGHIVIAAEAYRNLSPQLQAQVFDVLKAHPDFAKWQASYHPNATMDLSAYVFMRSSSWPDEIRRKGNPYDHPDWHFIDYPLRPPSFPMELGPKPTNDVLFGISECEKNLGDTDASPEVRAVYLSWLIHLIGDLHQPLHCASLFTDAYPKGDRGGNDFFIKPAQRGIRLHGLWDGLLGSSSNPRTQWNYAIELQSKFSKATLPELTKHKTPKDWSLESRSLAIKAGYLHGDLKGSTQAEDAPSLPADYTKSAKAVAERQGALAGYRLADEIGKFLKCGVIVPLLPANTNTTPQIDSAKKINAMEAAQFYDETLIVTGKVARVSIRPTITFLDLEKPSPNSPFTAVIFPENVGKFGELQKLQNQNVEISGTVTEFHNKPEIILESTDQIRVVGGN